MCLTGIHKQLSSPSVRIGLVTSVCHSRECVSLLFQVVLALLLSGRPSLCAQVTETKAIKEGQQKAIIKQGLGYAYHFEKMFPLDAEER